MKIKPSLAIVGTLLSLLLAACGVSSPPPPLPPASLRSVTLLPANPSIAPGTALQLSARGMYSNNTTADVTASAVWSTSDPTIASVSNLAGSKGLVTAGSTSGTAVISAVLSGITGSTVLSSSFVSVITVSTANPASIAPGTTKQFTAMGTLQDSAMQDLTTFVTWTTLDPSIATVSNTPGSNGVTTAVNAGSTTIEATLSAITGAAAFTSFHVASITTSPASVTIAKGLSRQFTANAVLADASPQNLTSFATWTTSSTNVGTFDNVIGPRGLLSSVNTGTTFVTAGFDSVISSPASTCVVTAAVVTSITVTPASSSIPLGKIQQYKAVGTFTDASKQDITATATWSSSNSAVAVVSNTAGSKGLATSKAEGTTVITASLGGKTSTGATLTVTPSQLVSILVTPLNPPPIIAGITLNTSIQFFATGTFSDNSLQDLTTSATWDSSNTNAATISNTGLATANFVGMLPGSTLTTNITASQGGIISNISVMTIKTQ